jgi:hypothetical protein
MMMLLLSLLLLLVVVAAALPLLLLLPRTLRAACGCAAAPAAVPASPSCFCPKACKSNTVLRNVSLPQAW